MMIQPLENRKEKLAIIHLARKDRGLDDDAYRALLSGAAGIESAADLTTVAQFNAIMAAFSTLGFVRKPARKKLPVRQDQQGDYCSPRQLYYIKGLWELASRSKTEAALTSLLKRIAHVDDMRFLSPKAASAVILALKDICRKAGFNPDHPEGGSICSPR
jgi:hypothetical protein